jgi:hypothetical protein
VVKTALWDYLITPYQYDIPSSAYAQQKGPWHVAGVVRVFAGVPLKPLLFLYLNKKSEIIKTG